jgi:hypothetical protein
MFEKITSVKKGGSYADTGGAVHQVDEAVVQRS